MSGQKKNTTFIVLLVVVLVVAVGAALYFTVFKDQLATSQKTLKFAMVTDVGGLGDQSFNDSAYAGLKRAAEELGAEIQVVESKKMDDYEPNLRSLADQKYDLIWAVGFLMTDALKNVAAQYPDVKFGLIDSVVDLPNVMSVTFKEHEGSFLVGVIAAMTTKTKTVGFVGGMQFPLIEKFEAGFKAGVKAVDPAIKVLTAYTGKFDDPGKGKELALAQFSKNADVIYHASGACGIGVIEAAKEKGLWAIGVDSDQNALAPDNVLTSMMKRVDNGVFQGCEAVANGTYEGKVVALGLKEEGVGYAPTTDKNASPEAMAKADEFAAKIADGTLVIPEVPADVANFSVE